MVTATINRTLSCERSSSITGGRGSQNESEVKRIMDSKDFSLLQPYCENDMKLLKRMSQSIFMKFNEPLSYSDYDDFYSIANMTLWQAYNSYNPDMGIKFEGFLHTCLKKKFKTELTHRHRHKRVLNQFTISLDAIKEDEKECSLLDIISSDFDTFEEAVNKQGKEQFQDKVQKYISMLSKLQVKILNLLMEGYKPNEIQKELEISSTEYAENMRFMRSYENVKVLF